MLLMNLAGETCPGVRIFLYCCLTSSRVIFVDIKKAVRGLTFYVKWVVLDLYVNFRY